MTAEMLSSSGVVERQVSSPRSVTGRDVGLWVVSKMTLSLVAVFSPEVCGKKNPPRRTQMRLVRYHRI